MLHTNAVRFNGIVLTAMLFTSLNIIAQQAVTRVEGVIRDEVTGTPVGCKIYIVGPNGKKQTLSSNSKDGSFLMVVNDAGQYKVTLSGYMVYRKDYSLNVPSSTKFQEIKQDYTVKVLHEGDMVLTSTAFDLNSASFNSQAKNQLNQLQDLLKTNQEMTIVATVMPDVDLVGKVRADSMAAYDKAHAKWVKDMAVWKKKNKKKQVTEPPVEPVMPTNFPDPNLQLVKDRKVAVLSYLHDVKNSDLRIRVVEAPLPSSAMAQPTQTPTPAAKTTKKGKKSDATTSTSVAKTSYKQHDNLIVKIGTVKRLFD